MSPSLPARMNSYRQTSPRAPLAFPAVWMVVVRLNWPLIVTRPDARALRFSNDEISHSVKETGLAVLPAGSLANNTSS